MPHMLSPPKKALPSPNVCLFVWQAVGNGVRTHSYCDTVSRVLMTETRKFPTFTLPNPNFYTCNILALVTFVHHLIHFVVGCINSPQLCGQIKDVFTLQRVYTLVYSKMRKTTANR